MSANRNICQSCAFPVCRGESSLQCNSYFFLIHPSCTNHQLQISFICIKCINLPTKMRNNLCKTYLLCNTYSDSQNRSSYTLFFSDSSHFQQPKFNHTPSFTANSSGTSKRPACSLTQLKQVERETAHQALVSNFAFSTLFTALIAKIDNS